MKVKRFGTHERGGAAGSRATAQMTQTREAAGHAIPVAISEVLLVQRATWRTPDEPSLPAIIAAEFRRA